MTETSHFQMYPGSVGKWVAEASRTFTLASLSVCVNVSERTYTLYVWI